MNKPLAGALLVLSLIVSSCASHYQLTGVQRSRLLVDSRYDDKIGAEVTQYMHDYKTAVDSVMSPVMGTIARDMAAFQPESELSNLLSDILVWGAQSYNEKPNFAVYNMGGIRAAFSKGVITYGDILEVAPFENKICFLTLSGTDLLTLFKEIAAFGGQGVSHGVQLVIDKEGNLLSARLHGQEIRPDGQYRVVTLDYLAQGNDGLLAFKRGTNVNSPQDNNSNVRFIIMNYFQALAKQGKAVDSQKEGRIAFGNK